MSNHVNNLICLPECYSILNQFYDNSLSGRKVMSANDNNASFVTTRQRSGWHSWHFSVVLCKRYRLRLLDRKSRSPRDEPLTAQILLVTVSTWANRFCAKPRKCFLGNTIRKSCVGVLRDMFWWCQRLHLLGQGDDGVIYSRRVRGISPSNSSWPKFVNYSPAHVCGHVVSSP